MRPWVFLIVSVGVLTAQTATAQPFWSVGPKLGYTFGENGGVTIGAEASYFPVFSSANVPPYALTFDINSWKGHVSVHAGFEVWYLIGADIGPTVFFTPNNVTPGISIILWDGVLLYPYFEFGIPFGGPGYHSVGGYLKFPIPTTAQNHESFSFG
ncbi:MAG TPA: hypothetical protein VGM92_13635 [Candidatus Kapabacteria bacterium]